MKMMLPPSPPLVALADRGGSDRLRLRLHQVTLSTITVLATAWCVTLGAVPAIISLASQAYPSRHFGHGIGGGQAPPGGGIGRLTPISSNFYPQAGRIC